MGKMAVVTRSAKLKMTVVIVTVRKATEKQIHTMKQSVQVSTYSSTTHNHAMSVIGGAAKKARL